YVASESSEHLGYDALGVEAGTGIHRVRRIMVDEFVGQDHRAHPQTAVEHAVVGQRLHDVRTEHAYRTFLDREQDFVLASQLQHQLDVQRFHEAGVGNRGGKAVGGEFV